MADWFDDMFSAPVEQILPRRTPHDDAWEIYTAEWRAAWNDFEAGGCNAVAREARINAAADTFNAAPR